MGLFGGASSASSSQTLSNTVSINPIFNMGSDNDTSSGFDSKTDATSSATAETKDEFGMAASAGVAIGGGQAQGGAAHLARNGDTDLQPNRSAQLKPGMSQNTLLMGGGFVVLGGLALYFLNKKKR